MSYWRPSPQNIYVIGDLHGKYNSLCSILKRILPLKDKDELIFLGDYIDRGPSSAKVLEKLCEIKSLYGDQVTCLLGNHELMMLEVLGIVKTGMVDKVDLVWLQNGGVDTIRSYAIFSDMKDLSIPLERFKSIVPQKHKDLLMSLDVSYETSNYIFCHGGYDPFNNENNTLQTLLWDKSLYSYCIGACVRQDKMPWTKTIVAGHNWKGPFIYDKFMMLDTSGKKDVLCLELNSMNGFWGNEQKSRLVKADIKETTKEDILKEIK